MDYREYDEDLVDLGMASAETHGAEIIGLEDVQPVGRYLTGGGIGSED